MTLYESNFIRLGWLAPDLRGIERAATSTVAGGPPLELSVLERCRYTTTIAMTYLFADGAGPAREPELEIRVYHDARLAEARGTATGPSHPQLGRIAAAVPADRDHRWSCNMLLNKWLEYCAGSGHRFVPPPG